MHTSQRATVAATPGLPDQQPALEAQPAARVQAVNRDGAVPRRTSDGEESDTTLMPCYGFVPYNEPAYLNYMRFSMSTNNAQYSPGVFGIEWGGYNACTAPGFNKGLCAATDADSLFGAHGYYTEIQNKLDADGSLWWHTFNRNADEATARPMRGEGKSGWFSGVHTEVFVSRFLGITYDAPKRTLRFAPQPMIGAFEWNAFPMGNDRFGVSFQPFEAGAQARVKNSSRNPVTLDIMLPVPDASCKLAVNGQITSDWDHGKYLGHEVFHAVRKVGPGETVDFQAAK